MNIIGCIPARYHSTRLPGKPLCDIAGKPMIIHICERASRASCLSQVVVLTDDERIQQTVQEFGYEAVMTSEECRCGTERLIEYAASAVPHDLIVNIQGDEILLDPHHIDALVNGLINCPQALMSTLAHRVSDPSILSSPTTAKVVVDKNQNALYFSRHCIPVQQDGTLPNSALVQIGMYAYRSEALALFAKYPPSSLESIEKLEQLRALENGISIHVVEVTCDAALSVDTPEDLEQARKLLNS